MSTNAKILNKFFCPACENDSNFLEVAEDTIITTYYSQNSDGSFTQTDQNFETLGEVRLICGICGENLDIFHDKFRELVF